MRKHEKRYSIAIAFKDDHCYFEQVDNLPIALRTMAIFYEDHPEFSSGHIMDNTTGRCLVIIDKGKGDGECEGQRTYPTARTLQS